jgi:Restriction endonuclease
MQQQYHKENDTEAHKLSKPETLDKNDYSQGKLYRLILYLERYPSILRLALFVVPILVVIVIALIRVLITFLIQSGLLEMMGKILVALICLGFAYIIALPDNSADVPQKTQKGKQGSSEYERREAIKREAVAQVWTLERLRALTPSGFEQVVAMMLERSSYTQVEVVGGSGDLGVDIKAIGPSGEQVVVQCKRYSAGNNIGSYAMQAFYGMTLHHRADKGIYVTTSSYTRQARELGEQHGIQLIDGESLAKTFRRNRYKDIHLA